jgi:hypothetical protein
MRFGALVPSLGAGRSLVVGLSPPTSALHLSEGIDGVISVLAAGGLRAALGRYSSVVTGVSGRLTGLRPAERLEGVLEARSVGGCSCGVCGDLLFRLHLSTLHDKEEAQDVGRKSLDFHLSGVLKFYVATEEVGVLGCVRGDGILQRLDTTVEPNAEVFLAVGEALLEVHHEGRDVILELEDNFDVVLKGRGAVTSCTFLMLSSILQKRTLKVFFNSHVLGQASTVDAGKSPRAIPIWPTTPLVTLTTGQGGGHAMHLPLKACELVHKSVDLGGTLALTEVATATVSAVSSSKRVSVVEFALFMVFGVKQES